MEVEDIALTLTPGIGAKGAAHLLGRFGTARRIFAASRDELVEGAQLREELARRILKREGFSAAEREAVYCRRNGIVPVASTDEAYPVLLRETPDYPHVLYISGEVSVLRRTTLTMVGTRRMSCYGRQMAERLVGELADRAPGTVVVSGLAFGIDTACHRAALAFGLPTVGVIASVLPSVTPAQHAAVARDMIERGGAVVSELHSQSRQNGSFYLARNRILAGMSGGTVVVESPLGGGSMATARMADGYDRTVMAVPGRATDAMSAGVNALIRDRKAQLVLSGEDIVREMMWDVTRPHELVSGVPAVVAEFTREEREVLGCFPAAGECVSVERLAERSGLAVGELSALLLGLEMAGAIRQLPGNRYVRL